MHIVHGQLRKAPFIKNLTDSTMYAVELSEMIKDYKTGEKTYTNYKAILFAKSDAHVNHYNNTLIEGNFIVLTSDKLKVEVSKCGKHTKLYMDNARLEGSGFIQSAPQQAQSNGFQPQQQQQQQQAPSQQLAAKRQEAQGQGGFTQQQQAPKVNPQEPSIDFDDDIPF